MPRQYINTALGQLHIRVEGAGPPLLLLGSAGRSARMFDHLIPLLADRFQLIAPDMFGHGNSDPLPVQCDIRAIAGCLAEVLDAYGLDRAHVYGFHSGNKIGTALAATWPQRVDRLILAGQSHSIIASNEARNRIIGGRTKEYFTTPREEDEVSKALAAWATLQRRLTDLWWPDALLTSAPDRLNKLAQTRTYVIDELQSFDSTAPLYSMNFSYDLASDLEKIQARTLVLEITTADEDRLIGRQGAAFCECIANGELQTLAAEGFRITLEDQAPELAKILRQFLEPS